MRLTLLVSLVLLSCKSPDTSAVDTAPSVTPVIEAPQVPLTIAPAKWVIVAGHSKVYTASRVADADNRVKLSNNVAVSNALDSMAKQPASIEGIKEASRIAREAQDKLNDAAMASLLDDAGLMVIHGLVNATCREHDDVAANKALLAVLREMPLPKHTDAHGFVQQAETERAALDQEMQLVLDDKVWKSASTGAPPPKRNVP
jgi:hypothetical protein